MRVHHDQKMGKEIYKVVAHRWSLNSYSLICLYSSLSTPQIAPIRRQYLSTQSTPKLFIAIGISTKRKATVEPRQVHVMSSIPPPTPPHLAWSFFYFSKLDRCTSCSIKKQTCKKSLRYYLPMDVPFCKDQPYLQGWVRPQTKHVPKWHPSSLSLGENLSVPTMHCNSFIGSHSRRIPVPPNPKPKTYD